MFEEQVYKSFFNENKPEPEPESSGERIYPALRSMEPNVLQRQSDDRDKSDQRTKELEGSLGLALEAIKRLEMTMQSSQACKPKEEPKKAPMVLMEDNLTKAKKALMTPKRLCPTATVVYAMEAKDPEQQDQEKLAKLREVLIKKTREYSDSFPKYNGESKKGQEWCGEICFHARKYRVDTIAPEDVKFAIFGAVQGKMRNRVLHLEPGTVGFDNYTAAEYLEELLGRFMNARTKGGAKEEFKHKKQE